MTEERQNNESPETGQRVEYGEDSVTVHLREPLIYKPGKMDEEQTDHKLVFPKKIKGKHLKAMDQVEGEINKTLALIAKASGVPRQAMDELDGRDMEAAIEALEPFLPNVPGTGR